MIKILYTNTIFNVEFEEATQLKKVTSYVILGWLE